mgnify:CR=1 FL=1
MSFHNTTHVKRTRRTRRCNWCGEMIQKGDPSVAHAGNYDGDFYQGRYHPECNAAIDRWWKAYRNKGNEFPDYLMNRGGIEERGEPETDPINQSNCGHSADNEKAPGDEPGA